MKLGLFLLSSLLVCPAQELRFVYPVPPPTGFSVRSDVAYKKVGTTSLAMDLFRPANGARGQRFPVLVFFNGFGGNWTRSSPQFRGWAKAATAHGFAAVNEDSTPGHVEEDFDTLALYLKEHAEDLQIDPERHALIIKHRISTIQEHKSAMKGKHW